MRQKFLLGFLLSLVASTAGSSHALAAVPNSLFLNEANTVSGDTYLEDDKTDPTLGRIEGNGQNWMEFVVAQGDSLGGGTYKNTLDLRGWKIEWSYQKPDEPDQHGSGAITFTNDAQWAAVPRGTLLTISEWKEAYYLTNPPPGGDPYGGKPRVGGINGLGNLRNQTYDPATHTKRDFPTDLKWAPHTGDWTMNVWAGERNPNSTFKYFNFTGSVSVPSDTPGSPDVYQIGLDDDAGLFAVNNDNWVMTIKDAQGNTIQGPIGESIQGLGLGSDEILKVEGLVGSGATQANYLNSNLIASLYEAGSSSTWGKENVWNSGTQTQDLRRLRTWLKYGDADFDGSVTGADFNAWVARTGNAWQNGDFNGDGVVGGADFNLWVQRTNVVTIPGSLVAVPEPTSTTLLVLGGGLLATAFARRKGFRNR